MKFMNRDRAPEPLAATYSEYCRVYNNISVVRRPQGHLEYMQALGFSGYVLKTLNTGYVLPFVELPKGAVHRNNALASAGSAHRHICGRRYRCGGHIGGGGSGRFYYTHRLGGFRLGAAQGQVRVGSTASTGLAGKHVGRCFESVLRRTESIGSRRC